ncbi:MAG: enoyl-CoA hydratase/isomerase family protein, partial [Deltaproteobacteria bacterium]|nr:enoyl-CoA hydratase/isomerase family protein [Deltaproteobacteria bacterium]
MEPVILEKKQPLALITLNRPEKLNAINHEAATRLIEITTDVENDDTIRVVIITGSGGRAFSSGSDITELRGISGMELRQRIESPLFVRKLSKPVIAMIRGYALGGGLELALACDIRIASENAQFGLPETGLGWLPGGGGTQFLPRLVGEGMAMKMILSGRFLSAAEAKQVGLVEDVVPDDRLEAETEKLATEIAKRPLHVLRFAKEAIRASFEIDDQARLN